MREDAMANEDEARDVMPLDYDPEPTAVNTPATLSRQMTPSPPSSDEQIQVETSKKVQEVDTKDVELGGGDEKDLKKKMEPELTDQTNYVSLKKLAVILLGLNSAGLCSVLDQTIVATVIPVLGKDLGHADIAPWLGTAYFLTSTSCMPLYGRLSDIFGRKFCLLVGLSIFLVGSILSATAKSMIELIIVRAISGVGAGGIVNLVFIILSDLIPLAERGKYQGIYTAVTIIGTGLGPIVGGLFTEKVSWRWCFWINVPLTALAIVSVTLFVPYKRTSGDIKTKLKRIDYGGSALTLAWTILVLIALSWGGVQYSWTSAATLAPLLIGFACLGAFIVVEWKVAVLPIMPMRIFRDVTVSSGLLATFLGAVCLYGNLYYLPQFFQVVKGMSPINAGVHLLPTVLCQSGSVLCAGYIVAYTKEYRIITYCGFALTTIGQGLLTTIDKDTSEAKLAVYQVLSSVGNGLTPQTLLLAIQSATDRKDMAVASATRTYIRQLGGTIAITLCSAILNNSFRTYLGGAGVSDAVISKVENDPTSLSTLGLSAELQALAIDGFTSGVQNIFRMLTASAGVCALAVFFFLKQHDLTRPDDAARKAAARLKESKGDDVSSDPEKQV